MVGTTTSQSSGIVTRDTGQVDKVYLTPENSLRPIPDGPATFKIFWARMDYLLGKSDKWMTLRKDLDLLIERKSAVLTDSRKKFVM